MAIRLVLALLVALAGLPRLGVGLGTFGSSGYQDPGCCAPKIEPKPENSCCERKPVIQACPMSGGDCRCAFLPLPDEHDHPQAPAPRTERESTPVVVRSAWAAVSALEDRHLASPRSVEATHLPGVRSHNAVRAFLGVWRT